MPAKPKPSPRPWSASDLDLGSLNGGGSPPGVPTIRHKHDEPIVGVPASPDQRSARPARIAAARAGPIRGMRFSDPGVASASSSQRVIPAAWSALSARPPTRWALNGSGRARARTSSRRSRSLRMSARTRGTEMPNSCARSAGLVPASWAAQSASLRRNRNRLPGCGRLPPASLLRTTHASASRGRSPKSPGPPGEGRPRRTCRRC